MPSRRGLLLICAVDTTHTIIIIAWTTEKSNSFFEKIQGCKVYFLSKAALADASAQSFYGAFSKSDLSPCRFSETTEKRIYRGR